MAAGPGVLLGVRDVFLLRETLEGREHAAAGLLRRVEEGEPRLVGRQFLLAPLGQQRAHDDLVATIENALARAAQIVGGATAGDAARNHQADAEDLRQQCARLVLGDACAQGGHVAAGDVAALVCDHADHLVGRLRLHQRAGVDEDVAAIEHEGVEGVILHDAYLDAPGAEAGRMEDGARVVVEQVLDLGVADQRQVLRLRGCGCQGGGQRKPAQRRLHRHSRAAGGGIEANHHLQRTWLGARFLTL